MPAALPWSRQSYHARVRMSSGAVQLHETRAFAFHTAERAIERLLQASMSTDIRSRELRSAISVVRRDSRISVVTKCLMRVRMQTSASPDQEMEPQKCKRCLIPHAAISTSSDTE